VQKTVQKTVQKGNKPVPLLLLNVLRVVSFSPNNPSQPVVRFGPKPVFPVYTVHLGRLKKTPVSFTFATG
jgi:hypothetical protein